MNVGFYMVLGIAAINEIPMSILEAAIIDGATRWTEADYIKIPLIWSTVKVSFIFFIISIFLLRPYSGHNRRRAAGSTEVLGSYMMSFYMTKTMMGSYHVEPNFGYASAIAVSTFYRDGGNPDYKLFPEKERHRHIDRLLNCISGDY
jgi:ABC-type sugar transport system permease subunit